MSDIFDEMQTALDHWRETGSAFNLGLCDRAINEGLLLRSELGRLRHRTYQWRKVLYKASTACLKMNNGKPSADHLECHQIFRSLLEEKAPEVLADWNETARWG